MAETFAALDWYIKAVVALAAVVMPFLGAFFLYRREARLYEVQKIQAAKSPAGLVGIGAALASDRDMAMGVEALNKLAGAVIDLARTQADTVASDKVKARQLDTVVNEMTDMRRSLEEIASLIKRRDANGTRR